MAQMIRPNSNSNSLNLHFKYSDVMFDRSIALNLEKH